MLITREQLDAIIPGNSYVDDWLEALNEVLPQYDIVTPERIAAFLAQTAHESGGYKLLEENLNYRAESLVRVWPSRFPNLEFAKQYARQPERIANRAYANRMGNGPEESGDGFRYRGRGLIQLTGFNNYKSFADSIGMDVSEVPDYLTTFGGAVQSACWYWQVNNLNRWVDRGDFDGLSDVINIGRKTNTVGDSHGYQDRLQRYQRALQVLTQ